MGDEDGAVDNSIIGGQTIAAGTGGIDGSSFVVAGIAGEGVFPTETDDATKIRYYTPSFGGFSAGISFTPTVTNLGSGANNGQFIARKNGPNEMAAENITEGALVYDGDLGGVGLQASVVGQYGTLKNGAEESIADGGFGGKDWYSGVGGAALDLFGFKVAGSVGIDNLGDIEHKFMTAGIAYGFGPVNTSLTYAYIWDSNNDFETQAGYKKPGNLVLSADYAIAPGLVLAGDLASFDMDQTNAGKAATGEGDKGWAGVASVRLSSNLSLLALRGSGAAGLGPAAFVFAAPRSVLARAQEGFGTGGRLRFSIALCWPELPTIRPCRSGRQDLRNILGTHSPIVPVEWTLLGCASVGL